MDNKEPIYDMSSAYTCGLSEYIDRNLKETGKFEKELMRAIHFYGESSIPKINIHLMRILRRAYYDDSICKVSWHVEIKRWDLKYFEGTMDYKVGLYICAKGYSMDDVPLYQVSRYIGNFNPNHMERGMSKMLDSDYSEDVFSGCGHIPVPNWEDEDSYQEVCNVINKSFLGLIKTYGDVAHWLPAGYRIPQGATSKEVANKLLEQYLRIDKIIEKMHKDERSFYNVPINGGQYGFFTYINPNNPSCEERIGTAGHLIASIAKGSIDFNKEKYSSFEDFIYQESPEFVVLQEYAAYDLASSYLEDFEEAFRKYLH